MNKVVADASFCGAWIFSDESSEAAERLLEGMLSGSLQLVVPALWQYEMANMLKSGLVRGRLSESNLVASGRLLGQVPVHAVDNPGSGEFARIFKLATRYELSAYDAAYLELSDRLKVELMTADRKLQKAHLAMKRNW